MSEKKFTLVYQDETDGPIKTYTANYGAIQSLIRNKKLTEYDYLIFNKRPIGGRMHHLT